MRVDGAMGVVEAGYQLGGDERAWLTGIADACKPLDRHGLGLLMASFRGVGARAEAVAYVSTGPSGAAFQAMNEFALQSWPLLHRQHMSLTTSELAVKMGTPPEILAAAWKPMLHPLGVHDNMNIQGTDGEGNAVCVMVALPALTTLPHGTRRAWDRVAVHLGAALRLRRSLQADPLGGSHTVLSADGRRVLHAASGDASGLGRLREAARAVDAARSRANRDDPERALALWQGLVAGRWSLVDKFDTDGRRFVVARENPIETAEDLRLTRRERQVVSLVASGQTDDVAAYAMGLGVPTVRTHLARALKKLGLARPTDLLALAAHLGAHTQRREETRG